MAGSDVQVKVALRGVRSVLRGFSRVSRAGRDVGGSLHRDLGRISSLAGGVVRALSNIGGATALVGVGGLFAIKSTLQSISDLSIKVADEIDELQKRANSFGIESGRTVAGIRFAANNQGITDAEVDQILRKIRRTSQRAVDGNLTVLRSFERLGANWEDIVNEDGKVRPSDELLLNLSDRFARLGDDANKTAIAADIAGFRAGPQAVTLFNSGSEAIRSYIEDMQELRGIQEEDFDIAGNFKAQADRTKAAFDGFRTAIFRTFTPALQEVSRQSELFFVENRGAAEAFGRVTGDFLKQIVPDMIEAGRVLAALVTGNADKVADSPLKRIFEGAIAAVEAFTQGVLDVLELLGGGNIADAPPWLQSTISVLSAVKDFLADVAQGVLDLQEYWNDPGNEDAPAWIKSIKGSIEAVQDLIGWIDSLYDMLGVDSGAAKLGITLGLLAFSGTIATIIGQVGKLALAIGGLGTAAGGLAGGAGLGAAAGAAAVGYGAISTLNFEDQVDVARKRATELADTEGEAFAAAYLKTFLEKIPQEYQGFQATKGVYNLFAKLTGQDETDFEAIQAQLDVKIKEGSIEKTQAGMRKALAELGLKSDGTSARSDGSIGYQISSGLDISDVTISSEAQAKLDKIRNIAAQGPEAGGGRAFASGGHVRGPGTSTSDSIPAWLSDNEFVQQARAVRYYGVDFMRRLNNLEIPKFSTGGLARSVSSRIQSLRPPRFATGGLVSASAAPAPAFASAGASRTPINLTLPGVGTFPVEADGDVADDLLRAVRRTKRARL